jgi:transposase-like protein
MNNENLTPRKYKRYDESFKRSAVELWLQGGKSVEQIATDLGISTQSLKQWKKQLAALPVTGPGQRSVQQLEEENRRLKRELQGALRRCDILKKTLGILSTPNDGGMSA